MYSRTRVTPEFYENPLLSKMVGVKMFNSERGEDACQCNSCRVYDYLMEGKVPIFFSSGEPTRLVRVPDGRIGKVWQIISDRVQHTIGVKFPNQKEQEMFCILDVEVL
jgi:hypothetical protein